MYMYQYHYLSEGGRYEAKCESDVYLSFLEFSNSYFLARIYLNSVSVRYSVVVSK